MRPDAAFTARRVRDWAHVQDERPRGPRLQNGQLGFGDGLRFDAMIWLAVLSHDPDCEFARFGNKCRVCHYFGQQAVSNGISARARFSQGRARARAAHRIPPIGCDLFVCSHQASSRIWHECNLFGVDKRFFGHGCGIKADLRLLRGRWTAPSSERHEHHSLHGDKALRPTA